MNFNENISLSNVPPYDLDDIIEEISHIDPREVFQYAGKIEKIANILRQNNPDFNIFYEELIFEGYKIISEKFEQEIDFEKVEEDGWITKKDGQSHIPISGTNFRNSFIVKLIILKYFTELKKEGQSYQYRNTLLFSERLKNDLEPILATQLELDRLAEIRRKEEDEKYAFEIESHKAIIHKEVPFIFQETGIPLNSTLSEMFAEPTDLQGGRSGSGYTTVFRELSNYINNDLYNPFRIFDDSIMTKYFEEPEETSAHVKSRLNDISKKLSHPSHILFINMLQDIIFGSDKDIQSIPSSNGRNTVGTCTSAEGYFFDFVNLNNRKFITGEMHIITNSDNEPIIIEKHGVGEISCLTLVPLKLGKVEIPQGSMLQAIPKDTIETKKTNSMCFSKISNLDQYESFIFLRISTLSIDPELREETFGNHYHFQYKNQFVNYDWVEPKHYLELTKRVIEENL